jgi:hypothetical protein
LDKLAVQVAGDKTANPHPLLEAAEHLGKETQVDPEHRRQRTAVAVVAVQGAPALMQRPQLQVPAVLHNSLQYLIQMLLMLAVVEVGLHLDKVDL